ncbi:MAG: acetyl-CoA carboxylase, carboxyltransferase subunit beta [Candidatus Omnitrophica bacterium]|nr:acetyl-CoA carboxylase, carboxyltransferase subunit beta [Candidatus Omnitrophota bacterium]MCF7894751.1 acetyl-CoA carboxylase, carboxyltransferase subunit beta [Candidatus Omnitrophota bacterium]
MNIFKKTFGFGKKKRVPDGLWSKCSKCSNLIFNKILNENLNVCPKCGYHFVLNCYQRLKVLTDAGSFVEHDKEVSADDPLNFSGPKSYLNKLAQAKDKTKLKEAVITGTAEINKRPIILAITDSRFIMGSMGSAMGEKITRIIEQAILKRLPVIIVSGSGGGARMYEGMFSLMQMAKTSGALLKLKEARLPYLSILTHPTMAGVLASFAGLGDITIAEPGALIGFTGPRVIRQTIKQDLPESFQTSEFNQKHGFIDLIVERKDLKSKVTAILDYLT